MWMTSPYSRTWRVRRSRTGLTTGTVALSTLVQQRVPATRSDPVLVRERPNRRLFIAVIASETLDRSTLESHSASQRLSRIALGDDTKVRRTDTSRCGHFTSTRRLPL